MRRLWCMLAVTYAINYAHRRIATMYKITAGPGNGYTVTVDSADALAKLLRGQTYTLPRHDGVKMISYDEAQQIAVNAGREIPSSSLRSACQRRTIPGAAKQRGRWRMPENQFREWAGIPSTGSGQRPSAVRALSDEEILFGPRMH